MVAQVERRRARRGHDLVGRHRGAHPGDPLDVLLAVPHRVVRHVDDVVAEVGARRQDRGDPGHGIRAAIEDAIEVDKEEQACGGHRARMLPGRGCAPWCRRCRPRRPRRYRLQRPHRCHLPMKSRTRSIVLARRDRIAEYPAPDWLAAYPAPGLGRRATEGYSAIRNGSGTNSGGVRGLGGEPRRGRTSWRGPARPARTTRRRRRAPEPVARAATLGR